MKLLIASDIHGSASWCERLMEQVEREAPDKIILLGDLLYHGPRNPLPDGHDPREVARMLNEQAERIIAAVNSVSFSQNKEKRPDTLEEMIVQDADRLDAIGAIGIARTFAFGGEHGRPLEDSIQHFYNKLLFLKDLMNTESAKRMAQDRHEFLEEFLEKWEKETRK